jgi:hypothetical protein
VNAAGRAGLLAAAVAAATVLASCAGAGGAPVVGARAPTPATRDQLLTATGDAVWRGDLQTADAALTQLGDRELGMPDTALDFWSELIALLRCEPLRQTPQPVRGLVDPWQRLRRLVQIERVRLSRLASAAAPPAAASKSGAPAPRRQPERARPPGDVVWPVEAEIWTDELPTRRLIDRCPVVAPGGGPGVPPSRLEAALVSATAETLPPDHPASAVLLLHAAVLNIASGAPRAASMSLARLEALSPPGPAAPALALEPEEQTQLALVAALAAIEDERTPPDALLGRARAALAGNLPPATRRALGLRLSQRLRAAGRAEDAAAVLGAPPHGDDAAGRYIAFRQAEAHAAAGRRAELLAEARAALHDKSHAAVDADPALAAIMDLALRALLASPVSDATLEVLEALGPPRERLARAEMFGQLALSAAGHESAMATFMWLYQNDSDPGRQLQHLARASVAAARGGDRRQFALTFHLLAGDEEAVEPAPNPKPDAAAARAAASKDDGGRGAWIASPEADRVRQKRRAVRSANWQRALLVVARDALPALVEGDDQANLTTLVNTLKRHLADSGRGPVDEELTTLYRAASAHLKTGPRAYAETVGAARRPILLGDVLIGRKYEVPAPEVELVPAEVGPVIFVPRTGTDPARTALRRWPRRIGVALTGSAS